MYVHYHYQYAFLYDHLIDEQTSPKDVPCPVWLKLAQRFWRSISDVDNGYKLFHYHPFEKGLWHKNPNARQQQVIRVTQVNRKTILSDTRVRAPRQERFISLVRGATLLNSTNCDQLWQLNGSAPILCQITPNTLPQKVNVSALSVH